MNSSDQKVDPSEEPTESESSRKPTANQDVKSQRKDPEHIAPSATGSSKAVRGPTDTGPTIPES